MTEYNNYYYQYKYHYTQEYPIELFIRNKNNKKKYGKSLINISSNELDIIKKENLNQSIKLSTSRNFTNLIKTYYVNYKYYENKKLNKINIESYRKFQKLIENNKI